MRTHLLARRATLVGAVAAALTAALLVLQASTAAFTASTDNTGNFFVADQITLTDNDADNVMYEVAEMYPGDIETRCITVTYTGARDADVRLHAAIAGLATLAPALDITIDADTSPTSVTTDGSFACPVGYSDELAVQPPTKLNTFVDAANDHASGVGSTMFSDGQDVVYRFTVEFDDEVADINTYQGASVIDLAFTWEAQTS